MRWTLLHHRHPLLGTGRCCPSTRLPLSSPGSAPTTSSPALASCATRGSKRPRYRRVARRGHQQHRAQLHTKFNDLCAMAKSAVDRSEGQLREFAGKYFITDELMQYIHYMNEALCRRPYATPTAKYRGRRRSLSPRTPSKRAVGPGLPSA
jgi:hypothetical protein